MKLRAADLLPGMLLVALALGTAPSDTASSGAGDRPTPTVLTPADPPPAR